MNLSKRKGPRYPCRLPAQITIPNKEMKLDGTVLNISLGGAMISVKGTLTQPALALKILGAGRFFIIDASFLRFAGADPKDPASQLYVVTFVETPKVRYQVSELIEILRKRSGAGHTDKKTE